METCHACLKTFWPARMYLPVMLPCTRYASMPFARLPSRPFAVFKKERACAELSTTRFSPLDPLPSTK